MLNRHGQGDYSLSREYSFGKVFKMKYNHLSIHRKIGNGLKEKLFWQYEIAS